MTARVEADVTSLSEDETNLEVVVAGLEEVVAGVLSKREDRASAVDPVSAAGRTCSHRCTTEKMRTVSETARHGVGRYTAKCCQDRETVP